MNKSLQKIHNQIQAIKKHLKSPKLAASAKRHLLRTLTLLIMLVGKGEKANAGNETAETNNTTPNTEIKTSVSSSEIFAHASISEISLDMLKNKLDINRFNFSAEEFKAITPGPLSRELADICRSAIGKECKERCYAGIKKQLLKSKIQKFPYLSGRSAYMAKEELEKFDCFISSSVDFENYANVPDGTIMVFMPSKGHPHGHIAIKRGKLFLSDGQEIIANITEGKYGDCYGFISKDSQLQLIPDSSHLQELAAIIKKENTLRNFAAVPPKALALNDRNFPTNAAKLWQPRNR